MSAVFFGLGADVPFQNDPHVDVGMTVNGRRVQVEKVVMAGGRGGLYYRNAKGKKIYLKAYQRDKCVGKTLERDSGVCATKNVVRSTDAGFFSGASGASGTDVTSRTSTGTGTGVNAIASSSGRRPYGGFIAQ
jgi:hypothetical protein